MRWIRWAAGVAALALAACGARTELRVGDAGAAEETFAADLPNGGVAPDPIDAGAPPTPGPCFACRSPLLQECGYCLVQGVDTTWVCPIDIPPPERACVSLLEEHETPKGTRFTCWYCP